MGIRGSGFHRRYFRRRLGHFANVLPARRGIAGPAFAQSTNPYNISWAALDPGNDWAATVIRSLFPIPGSSGGTSTGNEATVITQIVAQFTGFVGAIAIAFVTYNVIMDEMQIGRTCARGHLTMLEDLGRVHRVRRTQPGRSAIYYTYHSTGIKAAPLLSKDEMFDLKAGATPRRRTFQVWAPHNHRDPLVAALFGPARREAA